MGSSRIVSLLGVCTCMVLGCLMSAAAPISGTFSYQGRLTNSGSPVTGMADLTFSLWDAGAAGAQIGADIVLLNVQVSDGLFNVDLDFGVAALDGQRRWLEIEARSPAGVGGYTLLSPRQPILGAPYAIQTRGLFVDDNLMVGVNTTSPGARLHVGGASPSLLVADGGNAGLLIDGTTGSPQRLLSFHSTDGGNNAGMQEGPWGGQWQSYDREGDGFLGLIATMGSSGVGGDGILHLYSKETGSLNVMLRADLSNTNDDSESGLLQLGSSGTFGFGGVITLKNNDGSTTVSMAGGLSGNGGALGTFDPTTQQPEFLVESDPDPGGGGRLTVARNDAGANGLYVDGNYSGTESVNVFMLGSPSGMSFLTDLAGNNSVILPSDSISAFETKDEAGAASAQFDGDFIFSGPIEIILSRTIVCPSAGYCLVIGTCETFIDHVNGVGDNLTLGVSNMSNIFPDNQWNTIGLSAAYPTGGAIWPLTVHGLFEASAGANTFYLLGDLNNGNVSVHDSQLTILFVPTAYGVVESTSMTNSPIEPRGSGTITQSDAAERTQAAVFDQERRDAELGFVRSQLEMALRRLEKLESDGQPSFLPITAPPDEAASLLMHEPTPPLRNATER